MKILSFLSVLICITLTSQILKGQNSVQIGSGNELYFQDNGQIRCLDNNHRILFRRSENTLEFREFGGIMFSPGAENGQQTAKMHITSNGDLGIGTTGPRGKFDIWGGTMYVTGADIVGTLVAGAQSGNALLGCNSLTNGIAINPVGNVGIGTTGPQALLSLGGGNGNNGKKFLIKDDGTANGVQAGMGIDMSGTSRELSIFHSTSDGVNGIISFGKRQESAGTYTEAMRITGAGNVGIGTTDTKNYKFAVNGNAIFNKVVVKAYPWADYVFHSNYRLRPLSEVEQYINLYHHLPEVPTAAEVEKNGVDVGDNQATLLKKIEELTLYVIEQEKQINKLTNENRELMLLKKDVEELKAVMKQLVK